MTISTMSDLTKCGVISVIRAPSADSAVSAAHALSAGGVTGIEITYSTPNATNAITNIANELPGVIVGAGTLRTIGEVESAAIAGARFLVAPGTTGSVTSAMIATGLASIGGALTPSEVMTAVEHGVSAVKIFPGSLGGPAYLKALRGPFPDVPLMPTGGVNTDNLGDWIMAGAFAVGVGTDLCSYSDMVSRDWHAITAKAERFTTALGVATP